MKKLKVLQILEATIGGTRTHLNLLVNHLSQDKFDISVACSTLRDKNFQGDISRMQSKGIKVYQISMVREINPVKDLLAFINIYRIIKTEKYDIVHTHSSKAGFLGRLAAKLSGVSMILYTPHAFAFQAYSNRIIKLFFVAIEKIMSRFSTRLICVSESENKIAIQNRITDIEKITVIHNAVESNNHRVDNNKINELKRNLGINNKRIVIGTVGYFRHQKGYPFFLKTAHAVIKDYEDIIFLIIGSGKRKLEIEKMIRSLKIEKYIIILDSFDHDNIYYSLMDIFVLTSLWEGMPYTILEAMCMGKPVIATDVTGSRDVVVHEKTGLLVPSKNINAIADAIIMLINDPKKRKILGVNGRKRIMESFLITDKIRDLETIYKN
jgi:glycosyltransferase involved in cell wall biosynthesis